MTVDLKIDEPLVAFTLALQTEARRVGVDSVLATWTFLMIGTSRKACDVPASRRQELLDALKLLPDKAKVAS
jgi:hypothetical protein